jgi:hypothetical protein
MRIFRWTLLRRFERNLHARLNEPQQRSVLGMARYFDCNLVFARDSKPFHHSNERRPGPIRVWQPRHSVRQRPNLFHKASLCCEPARRPGPDFEFFHPRGRNKDDRQLWKLESDTALQFDPVHSWHQHVRNQTNRSGNGPRNSSADENTRDEYPADSNSKIVVNSPTISFATPAIEESISRHASMTAFKVGSRLLYVCSISSSTTQ